MGLATPTAVMAGIGRAARNGILIKGGNTLEEFAKIKTIVFDKTGTLTTGKFSIKEFKTYNNFSLSEAKNIVYSMELFSSHPIAKSLVDELKTASTKIEWSKTEEEKGIGVTAHDTSGSVYFIGNARELKNELLNNFAGIVLIKNQQLIASISIEDEIKPSTAKAIQQLKSVGIKTILLSGDNAQKCNEVAQKIGIDKVYSEQLPHQKLEIIELLKKENPVAMVGDGVNDAPALTKANVGISLSNSIISNF